MAFLASALLWNSCVSTPRTGLRMSIYLGTAPRDGPFVYQRYLELARVIEGRTPNIGLTVNQHCLSPGSPSHYLALLPGTIPEVAVPDPETSHGSGLKRETRIYKDGVEDEGYHTGCGQIGQSQLLILLRDSLDGLLK